jgi:outer membrane protein assembly factor BamE (lipoprotein component of BamABCDE complex)
MRINSIQQGVGAMKLIIRLTAVLIVLFSQCGCQAMWYGLAQDMDKLKVGMTKQEVIRELGSPSSTAMDADKNEEQLIFRKMRGAMSWSPKLYAVTLRDGKAIKWGEQNP